MTRHAFLGLTCALAALSLVSQATAITVSDFSNVDLTGTYEVWNSATRTPSASNLRIQSTGDFGGGWIDLPSPVNAAGTTVLELKLDVNPGNVATLFNTVLIDGDGTERVYRFAGVGVGASQTLTQPLASFLQDNQPGTTPGLDLSTIRTFHLQGTFSNGNPGPAMDLTFDNLALQVPEPASAGLVSAGALGLVALVRRRSARTIQ